jgi:regulator of protease activity HflC (stomatin/prohibitin superfamily)
MRYLKSLLVMVTALALMPLTAGCHYKQIPAATVGILFDGSSGIQQNIITSKVVWVGMYQELILYPTSIKQATYVKNAKEGDKEGDNSIPATTAEGAILPMDITLAYHVQPDDAVKAFKEFGSADLDVIQKDYLRWQVAYAVNVVSGNHSIFDLISKDRSHIGAKVKKVLQPLLTPWGITADDVYVGEVYPSQEITDKIHESLAAKSDLDRSKNELTQAKIEATTILTNANRVAEQNRLLASQGDTAIKLKRLQLRREAIAKWDGRTPPISEQDIPFTDIKLSP